MRAIRNATILWTLLAAMAVACGPAPSTAPLQSPTEASVQAEDVVAPRCAPNGIQGQPMVFVSSPAEANPACLPHFEAGQYMPWLECYNSKHAQSKWVDALTSVGCYDVASGQWQIGGCPAAGHTIKTDLGSATTLGGLVPAWCDPSGDWKVAMELPIEGAERVELAVSGDAADRFSIVSRVEPPADTSVSGPITAALTRDSGQALEATPEILQIVTVEADGEPGDELLVSVVVRGDDELAYAFSALYLVPSDGATEPVLLLSSELEAFTVLALSDLDGDCAQEIVVRSAYYEGEYMMMFRFAGQDMVQLGGWGCGA